MADRNTTSADQPMPIAIVGMSCRLPGDVSTPGEFYRMLCRARSGWSKVPADRFNAAAYNHPNPDKKGCFNSQGGYFINHDLSMFDAGFFDITKKEAESMDPAQRLLLETAYEALENGGIPRESISGRKVGVFVGGNYNEHRTSNLRDLDHIPSFDATGNQGAFLAGRLAYYFNLRGPTYTVDTACSSSMHAVHLAVQSIRSGESEQALVGASHLITQPDIWVSMGKLRLFADAGKTYAFDHRAKSGYARGEGAGCLILKPLHKAQADNDHIYGVITHTGISHNGRTVGIVAPSPGEQEQLLRDVFAQAHIDPTDVGFFEAHGTGTKKGDPIEATAIYKAVGQHFTAKDPLYIGSSKPNVGHLECASGIVSIIKSTLMLYYGFILPNADFERENDAIPFKDWNMRVATQQRPWPSKKRYVCVNNFGFSGSNATCVLRAAPVSRRIELAPHGAYTTLRLFTISANDEPALRASMKKLGIWLEQHAELYQTTMPRNLAYTLCQRRSHLPWRVAITQSMCSGLAGALNSHDVVPMRASSEPPKLAFVFTGQGAQWHAMGRELLRTHPVFADAINRADKTLRDIGADFSILEELTRDKQTTKVGLAHVSQPICSAVQLALVDLLASFGIRPSAVTGHSSGEIGAAYAAGALTFESAMAAAYYRGQVIIELKQTHPGLKGSMMAVGAGADDLAPMLTAMFPDPDSPQAVVACENSPSSTTLSGDEGAIDAVANEFQARGVFNRKLFVDVAYHSPHMKLIAESYLSNICHIQPPTDMTDSKVEFYSSLRGKKIGLTELGPEYWVDNLTQAVRFSSSLQAMVKEHGPDILVEVGPHAALKGPIMQTLKKMGGAGTAGKISYLSALLRDTDATKTCLDLAGQLFVRGHHGLDFFNINHNREEKETPDIVPGLFSYPWSRQKYWYESRISQQHRLKPFARHDLLGTLADWSGDLEPTWRNIVRTSDLPWLKEYTVQERMVFPVAGFMSMAIEAASQRASLKGVSEPGRFEIKDLRVSEHLFLEDELEFEVVFNLRPSEEDAGADEFRISSYEAGRGWLDHCAGTVKTHAAGSTSARRGPSAGFHMDARSEARLGDVASSRNIDMSDSAPSSSAASSAGDHQHAETDTPETPDCGGQGCDKQLGSVTMQGSSSTGGSGSSENIYKYLGDKLAVSYPSAFQCLDEVTANETEVAAHCSPRDTVSEMPLEFETPYKLHPSILDAMLQLPLLSLGTRADSNTTGSKTAYLPCAIRHVSFSPSRLTKRANQTFCAHSTVEPRAGNTFMVESFLSPGTGAASISIAGLQLKALHAIAAAPAGPRELCFQFKWEPLKEQEQQQQQQASGDKAASASNIVIITDSSPTAAKNPLIAALTKIITTGTGTAPQISTLQSIADFSASHFIVLSELTTPLLSNNLTPAALSQIQKLLTTSPGAIWVTRGATRFPTAPNCNMALGLIRTARSELSAVASTLDLDPASKLDTAAQAALIHAAFHRSVLPGGRNVESPDQNDMEFAEEQGALYVPRIAADEELNLDVHRELGPSAPYLQEFYQEGRQLQLSAQSELLAGKEIGTETEGDNDDALFFEDDHRAEEELEHNEVEIFVAASAITQDDVAFVENSDSHDGEKHAIARGCAGTVTRVGKSVRHITVGSRVCALAEGAFGTHARALATSVVDLPTTLSVERAASVPVTFCAAQYALHDVARVRPGEKILIQLSGPVGVAAAEVAKQLGATAYVLVHNDAEADAAKRIGVSRDRVLDARSIYLRRQLEEATEGEGMEVILTMSGNETAAIKAWECLADFGRFVEIRTSEKHKISRPALGANATFTSVNMASLAAARPKAMEETLKAVMESFAAGAMQAPVKTAVFSASELGKGLERVRDGAVDPVVVVAGRKEMVKATHRKSESIFTPNGTHIIVGGTGGLGRSMAKYMVAHGARTIVLLSRSGDNSNLTTQLQSELAHPDARIVVKKCDATIETDVQQLVADLAASALPPISGVIHAAMVLRDVLLESMSHDDYDQVIRPKVAGTWNMHNVLAGNQVKLDYFVVLSSAAGILGSRGQAAYAAANTFLDAFVQFRRQNGLPGTSLDLTAVTGAGYLADNATREEDIIRNFGNETVSEQEVLALLSAAVRGAIRAPQCLTGLKLHLAADGNWPYYASDARFAALKEECLAAAEREGLVPKQTVSPGNAFRAAKSDDEAAAIAGQGILEKLSEVLTISVENLDVARNITSYGLDSLTAIELRNWIAKELRANLQILELLSSGTVNDLAALIVVKTRTN